MTTNIKVFALLLLCLATSRFGFSADTNRSGASEDTKNFLAIACRFESHRTLAGATEPTATREWYFWRQPNQVETREVTGAAGQIWELSPKGQISYQRIFHTARRVIEYSSGELRSVKDYSEWRKITSLLDPFQLGAALTGGEKIEAQGRQVLRNVGQMDGEIWEVLWLAQEQIPLRVRRESKMYTEVMQLKEVYPLAQAPWARNETAGYEVIDYADLGDKESDPFVRALLHGGSEVAH